jgi:hypothetical protein
MQKSHACTGPYIYTDASRRDICMRKEEGHKARKKQQNILTLAGRGRASLACNDMYDDDSDRNALNFMHPPQPTPSCYYTGSERFVENGIPNVPR